MKFKNLINTVVPALPAFTSGLNCLALIYVLHNWLPDVYRSPEHLKPILLVVAFTSLLLIFFFVFFIFSKATAQRSTGNSANLEISSLTQKIHHFRNIVDILVRSKVWKPGLKEYIDEEFGDLNYFQMKEFYKGKSKLAVEFIEQNNRHGETENLYLEAKSLLLNKPNQSKVDNFNNPREYDKSILNKWVAHKCGAGLWYFFGYKYTSFKEELDVNRIYERHQEKIMSYAIQIDPQRFQEFGFSEELLSKLGEHISEEILPKLYALTSQATQRLPKTVTLSYLLLLVLTAFGFFLPVAAILLELPPIFSFIAISTVMSTVLFVVLALYPFVLRQINKR